MNNVLPLQTHMSYGTFDRLVMGCHSQLNSLILIYSQSAIPLKLYIHNFCYKEDFSSWIYPTLMLYSHLSIKFCILYFFR